MTSFGAAGFAKGFATGFINERNRRLDEQKSKDEITLRYQLENLSKQKEEWKTKRDEENEMKANAEFVAKHVGDSSFAATAYEFLKTKKYTPKDLIEDYQADRFRRKTPATQTIEIPNPEVNPKISDVAVPPGVQNLEMTTSPENLQKQIPFAEQKLPQNTVETAQIDPLKASETLPYKGDPKLSETLDRVNKQIDEIDPTLRTFQTAQDERPDPSTILNKDGAMYEYVPPTKKLDLGTYAEEKVKLQDAIQTGDKVREARQRMIIRVMQEDMAEKAAFEAAAKNENFRHKVIVGRDGIMKNIIPVDPEGYNIATRTPQNPKGNQVSLAPGETMLEVSEDDVKYIRDIQKEAEKPKQDYDMQKAITIESMDLGKTVHDIMSKPGNEHLNATSSGVLKMIDDGFANVESIRDMLTLQQNGLTNQRAVLDNLLKKEVSPEEFSSELGKLNRMVANSEEQLKKLPHNALSAPLQQQTLDKIRLDNALLLLAYNSALAAGQTAGKMSDKDLELRLKTSGKDAQSKGGLLSVVYQELMAQRKRLDTHQRNLKDRFAERQKTLPPGFDIGLAPRRLGDYYEQQIQEASDRDKQGPEFMDAIRRAQFFNGIEGNFKRMSSYTRDEMSRSSMEAQQNQEIPKVTKEQWLKLPPGTKYIPMDDPSGKVMIKK